MKAKKATRPKQPNGRGGPHWTEAELRIADRFARAVIKGRYPHAKAAAPDCRTALAPLRDRPVGGVHLMLIKRARVMGRGWIHHPWNDAERKVLDRFARAVADGRFRTAREAGPACLEALTRLHERYPKRYAGVPVRSIHTIQTELWPRLAKLRDRWFNSHWSKEESELVDRYSRMAIEHRYPNLRAAARACTLAINRMHSRRAKRRTGRALPVPVRTLPGVFDQLFDRTRKLDVNRLPHRRWTPEENRVAARWARKYGQHLRGKARAGIAVLAKFMQSELDRAGYYRTVGACQAAIMARCPESGGERKHRE